MFSEDLKKLWGFHPMQDAFFQSYSEEGKNFVPARVTFSSHERYRVLILGEEQERPAKLRGHFYYDTTDLPVVGDWVVLELLEGDSDSLPIEALLPRRTCLKRSDSSLGEQVLMANVDVVALVTSFNQDLNERRLERGLLMIEESGAKALVILNKSDLVDKKTQEKILEDLALRLPSVPILSCSALNGQGIQDILNHFEEGQSVSALGMSGVGKSTLINVLLEEEALRTQEIREDDSRGKHTTTHRELFKTKQGFWLLDSPGIREFSSTAEAGALETSFEDVTNLIACCRFGDCTHQSEPGCGIRGGLAEGILDEDRWQNYLKLKREMEFHLNKGDKAHLSQRKKEHIKRNKNLRQRLKAKGRQSSRD